MLGNGESSALSITPTISSFMASKNSHEFGVTKQACYVALQALHDALHGSGCKKIT